jgi:hypothetical protein
MIIRYLGYTLVRAGRYTIVVSDNSGTVFEAPTWDAAMRWIDAYGKKKA